MASNVVADPVKSSPVMMSRVEGWVQKNPRLAVITTIAFAILGIAAVAVSAMLSNLPLIALSGLTAVATLGASVYFAAKCVAHYSRATVPESSNAPVESSVSQPINPLQAAVPLTEGEKLVYQAGLTKDEKLFHQARAAQQLASSYLEKAGISTPENLAFIEQTPFINSLAKVLSLLQQNNILLGCSTSLNFDKLIKNAQHLREFEVALSALHQSGILSAYILHKLIEWVEQEPFSALSLSKSLAVLQKVDMLTEDNFTRLFFGKNTVWLDAALQALMEAGILTQPNFDALMSRLCSDKLYLLGSALPPLQAAKILNQENFNRCVSHTCHGNHLFFGEMLEVLQEGGALKQKTFDQLTQCFYDPAILEGLTALKNASILTPKTFRSLIQHRFALSVCQGLSALQQANILTLKRCNSFMALRESASDLSAAFSALQKRNLLTPSVFTRFIWNSLAAFSFNQTLLSLQSAGIILTQEAFNDLIKNVQYVEGIYKTITCLSRNNILTLSNFEKCIRCARYSDSFSGPFLGSVLTQEGYDAAMADYVSMSEGPLASTMLAVRNESARFHGDGQNPQLSTDLIFHIAGFLDPQYLKAQCTADGQRIRELYQNKPNSLMIV